jgi:hypothetical protein
MIIGSPTADDDARSAFHPMWAARRHDLSRCDECLV